MEPLSILLALTVMILAIVIPGAVLSYAVIREATLAERFGLSIAFGTCSVYVAFLVVKNGLAVMDVSTVGLSMLVLLLSWVFTRNGRNGAIRWLFASRDSRRA